MLNNSGQRHMETSLFCSYLSQYPLKLMMRDTFSIYLKLLTYIIIFFIFYIHNEIFKWNFFGKTLIQIFTIPYYNNNIISILNNE